MKPVRHFRALGKWIWQSLAETEVAFPDGSAAASALRTAARCRFDDVGHPMFSVLCSLFFVLCSSLPDLCSNFAVPGSKFQACPA